MFDQIIAQLHEGGIHISTDTRTILPGDVFVAIKGEVFDGHAFISQAISKGASVCIVEEKNLYVREAQIAYADRLILVDDSIKALHGLARQYRETFDIPVIGVSGCNGKTTTKNMLVSIFKKYYGDAGVLYTIGNNNNHIGVPLTILSKKKEHKVAIVELGSNHPGEIDMLCTIAKPTHGITTNIGAAHIEFFGSLEAIADEEGSLANYVSQTGEYVLLKKDMYSEYIAQKSKAHVHIVDAEYVQCLDTHFSIKKTPYTSNVDNTSKEFKGITCILNELGILAPHIVDDAFLAITLAYKMGVPADTVLNGLKESTNDKARFDIKNVSIMDRMCTIVDDTYNANPDSVIASMKSVSTLYPTARKILVLGELRELGSYLSTGYKRIIQTAKDFGFSEIVCVNIDISLMSVKLSNSQEQASDVSIGLKIYHCVNNTEAIQYIKKTCCTNDVFLCKGSHGAKMWEVVQGVLV